MFSECETKPNTVVLSVYWSGTSTSIEDQRNQISLFAKHTKGIDVTNRRAPIDATHLKMCFDGCGVTHGMTGTLFAVGIQEQCDEVCMLARSYLLKSRSIKCTNSQQHRKAAVFCGAR